MASINFTELVTFMLINIFGPGPNNIASMSQSVLFGFKRTQPFLLGVCIGVFMVQILCALFSTALLSAWQGAEMVLRIIGSLYILWLAWSIIVSATSKLEGDNSYEEVLTFERGMFFQFINPKGILFGLTIFSSFLASEMKVNFWILAAAASIAILTYLSTSLWAFVGQAISRFLAGRVASIAISIILALLLVAIAFNLSGIEAIIG